MPYQPINTGPVPFTLGLDDLIDISVGVDLAVGSDLSVTIEPPGEPWTLDGALMLCRRIENLIRDLGSHAALGGSVLHKGESDKDCDIFIYPHKSPTFEIIKIMDRLEGAGIKPIKHADHRAYGDDKIVIRCFDGQRRIDLFFVK